MEILVLLIPISVLFIAIAIWAFVWATKHGQFDKLDENALNIFESDSHEHSHKK